VYHHQKKEKKKTETAKEKKKKTPKETPSSTLNTVEPASLHEPSRPLPLRTKIGHRRW
jgi:hypothetical protein